RRELTYRKAGCEALTGLFLALHLRYRYGGHGVPCALSRFFTPAPCLASLKKRNSSGGGKAPFDITKKIMNKRRNKYPAPYGAPGSWRLLRTGSAHPYQYFRPTACQ
ncbi:MAG: hypothetical protein WAW07_06045, partial [Bacteroidales bacterium]